MKIYTKVISKFNEETQSWEDIYEESYEDDGPIALCCGGGDDSDPAAEARAKAKTALGPLLDSSLSDMADYQDSQKHYFDEMRSFNAESKAISDKRYDINNPDSLISKASAQAQIEATGGYRRQTQATAEKARAQVKQATSQARQQASRSGFAGAGGGLGDSLQDIYRGTLMADESSAAAYQSAEAKRMQSVDQASLSMRDSELAFAKAQTELSQAQNQAIAQAKKEVAAMLQSYYSVTEDTSIDYERSLTQAGLPGGSTPTSKPTKVPGMANRGYYLQQDE